VTRFIALASARIQANKDSIVKGVGEAGRTGLDPIIAQKILAINDSNVIAITKQLRLSKLLDEVEAESLTATGKRKNELIAIANIIQNSAKINKESIADENLQLALAQEYGATINKNEVTRVKSRKQEIADFLALLDLAEKEIEIRRKANAAISQSIQEVENTLADQLDIGNQLKNLDLVRLALKAEELRVTEKITDKEYEQYTARLQQIADLREANIGIKKGINAYTKSIGTFDDRLADIAEGSLKAMEDGMVRFLDVSSDGFLEFGELAEGVLNSIYQQLIRQMIIQPLVSAGGQAAQGFVSGLFAEGGTVGKDGVKTQGFANGGLLQGGSGKRDDLFLGNVNGIATFAMGGEFITQQSSVNNNTRAGLDYINKTGQMPSGGTIVSAPVQINIENQSGSDIATDAIEELTRTNARGEEERVINIVLKKAQTDLNFRNALKG